MSGALEDRLRLFKVAAGGALLAVILFASFPGLLSRGCDGWGQRSDSRFYADCAGRFLETGQFRWSEVYPVALRAGTRVDMAWTAPAHPLAIAVVMQVSGLSAQESAVTASALSCLACLVVIVLAGWLLGGGLAGAFLTLALMLLLPRFWEYAESGGAESVSQLFLVGSAFLAALWLRGPSTPRLAALLAWSAFGCLARPQNQFLLLALVVLVRAAPAGGRIRFLAAWAAAVLAPMLLAAWLARGTDLVFPRTFCFLVGTPAHPGHSLFREYFPAGFGWGDLWAGRDQYPAKAAVGWRLLKMYWPGWLVPGGLLVAACAFGRARLLALAALLTLGASVFFGAAGFLVPRYWDALEPLVLLVLLASWMPLAGRMPWWGLSGAALMVIAGVVLWQLTPLVVGQRCKCVERFCPEELPALIREALPPAGLVAADRPSLVIETLRRPVLLCPETPEVLRAIGRDVTPVEAIIFSPGLSHGELAAWATKGAALDAMGYSRVSADGWVLWRRPPATSPAPTSPATSRPGP